MSPKIQVTATDARRLMLFGMTRLREVMEKGNVDYVRHYESYFDEVIVVYLYGSAPEVRLSPKTRLVSIGTGHSVIDLILSPFRLYRQAKELRPTGFLTADLVFAWWTTWLLRVILRAKIVLMPVSIPPEIYASTGRSLSGIPIFLEKAFMRLSFAAASKIIIPVNGEAQIEWAMSDAQMKRKLQVVAATVEEFPPASLFDALKNLSKDVRNLRAPARLLYVGRLHPEKLTVDLIEMMAEIKKLGGSVRLTIAGHGVEESAMRQKAKDLGVDADIEWLGFVRSSDLESHYGDADIFVSTVTGTALREAGLAGLPIVGYRADWVRSLLSHEVNALLVPVGDAKALAREVIRALQDHGLRARIAKNFQEMAIRRWNKQDIAQGLDDAFGQSS
jgi:glycosyltransferase involved in cell wall biosynthesis